MWCQAKLRQGCWCFSCHTQVQCVQKTSGINTTSFPCFCHYCATYWKCFPTIEYFQGIHLIWFFFFLFSEENQFTVYVIHAVQFAAKRMSGTLKPLTIVIVQSNSGMHMYIITESGVLTLVRLAVTLKFGERTHFIASLQTFENGGENCFSYNWHRGYYIAAAYFCKRVNCEFLSWIKD